VSDFTKVPSRSTHNAGRTVESRVEEEMGKSRVLPSAAAITGLQKSDIRREVFFIELRRRNLRFSFYVIINYSEGSAVTHRASFSTFLHNLDL
jgi:hypothetical protein